MRWRASSCRCSPAGSRPATGSRSAGRRRPCSAGRCSSSPRSPSLIAVLAEPIARLLLGEGDPAKVALAARFLLVFAPQVVLYGIGIVLTGVLQAHRRFAGPALAPLLSSLVVAAAYLLFAGIGGDRGRRGPDHPRRARPRRGDDARRRRAQPEPAGARCAACAWGCGRRCASRWARRPACGGWPWPGCSPWPASSSWPRWPSAWPTTARRTHAQVVYAAGLTLFLVPWAALAVPLATSAYPGLAERAEEGDEAGLRPVAGPGDGPRRRGVGPGRGGAGGGRRADGAGLPGRRFGRRRRVAARHDPGLRPRAGRLRPGRGAHPRPLRPGTLEGPHGVRRRRLAPGRRRRRRPRRRPAVRRPGAGPRGGAQPRRHRRRRAPCWSWSPARPAPRRCAACRGPAERPLLAAVLGGGAGWWVSRALGADPVPGTASSPPIGRGRAGRRLRRWWWAWPS